MKFALLIFCLWTLGQCSENWVPLPQIPSGRRSEYFLLQNDGGYKYGLDTGTGIFAKQSATAENEVKGHYGHQAGGKVINVKYTAGAQGFVPENPNPETYGGLVSHTKSYSSVLPINRSSVQNPDGSYSFSYESGGSTRSETRDRNGHVEGQYSYNDDSGYHDFSYKTGPGTGFVPIGGNLATPNGDSVSSGSYLPPKGSIPSVTTGSESPNPDGSYSFAYSTTDSARSESGDSSGQVQGKYSYKNEAGNHDLSYISGPETGFVATGGSLSIPNGLKGKDLSFGSLQTSTLKAYLHPLDEEFSPTASSSLNSDGSYSFGYSTGDSARTEFGDASGNVQGQYSYTNKAGHHDLSYIAGSETGFVATGGSLSVPNGLKVKDLGGGSSVSEETSRAHLPPSGEESSSIGSSSSNPDGSYNVAYATKDSARSESSDSTGHVQGQYSYRNEAGNHDLSYIAGPETGFVPTGGSLAIPNGLRGKDHVSGYGVHEALSASTSGAYSTPSGEEFSSIGSSSSNPDGSYSFAYSTSDSARSESSDSSGHVQGKYSYKNEAGNHDLSYISGPETGFVAIGGSLSIPNGLKGKDLSFGSLQTSTLKAYLHPLDEEFSPTASSSLNSDGSYSFGYSTGDSARTEFGDASGNVQGQYSYTNKAGHHDLSYIAGSETGFVATGGSLSVPNGLKVKDLGGGSSVSEETSRAHLPPSGEESSSTGFSSSNPDGSYNFAYSTKDSARSESSDSSGHVQGKYSYRNEAGNHDLSYIAGPETGFVPIGGSLAIPNGLRGKDLVSSYGVHEAASASTSKAYLPPSGEESSSIGSSSSNPDGSYSFAYSTSDSARSESGDSSGHVQGKYSYKNEAGNHDLSYISGAETGFVATGGSLSVPNGLREKELTSSNTINDIKQISASDPRKIYRSYGELKALNVLPVPGNYKSGYILY